VQEDLTRRSSGVLAQRSGRTATLIALQGDRATGLVAARTDETGIELWRVGQGAPLADLPGPVGTSAPQFTADGSALIVGGTTAIRWDLSSEHWLEWICTVTQRTLTRGEWQETKVTPQPTGCTGGPPG